MKRVASVAKLIPCVFVVMSVPLLFMALFGDYAETQFADKMGQAGIIFLLLLGSALILLSVFTIYRLLDRLGDIAHRRITIALFVLMALVTALFLRSFRAMHIADQFFVLDEARHLAHNPGSIIDTDSLYSRYFGRYGNNYFITVLFMHAYRLLSALHISDEYLVLCIGNALCVYGANALAYACVRFVRGPRDATKALVLLAMNPLSYTMVFWVYSCTLSIPLMVAGVYLALRSWRAEGTPARCALAVASGVNGALAYELRPTSMLPLAAALLLAVFYVCAHRERAKAVALQGGLCLATLVVLMKLLPAFYLPYVSQTQLDMNYPITHWVMMSSTGSGTFSKDAVLYTAQFETKEEKQRATTAKALDNYRKLGVSGTTRLFVKKLGITFSDGVSMSPSRLDQDEVYSRAYPFFAGEQKDLYELFCQSFRIATLLLMVAAGVSVWRARDFAPERYLLMTTLMGGYVFYCLWEAKSPYGVPFVPLMLCCAALGCADIVERYEAVSPRRRAAAARLSWASGFGILAFAGLIMYSVMAKTDYQHKDYVRRATVTCNQQADIEGMAEGGDTIAQEVTIDRPINRMEVSVADHKEGADPTTYRLAICAPDGRVLAGANFDSTQAIDGEKDSYVSVDVPFDPGDRPQDCVVKVSLEHLGDSPLVFRYRESASIDSFPGRAFVNDEEVPFDLELSAYCAYRAPYLRPRWCLALFGLVATWVALLRAASFWIVGIDGTGEDDQLSLAG